jgi:hypothetical protein
VPVLPAAKASISLRIDADVLKFFREIGSRYQSRMHAVLRSYMERTPTSTAKRSKKRGIVEQGVAADERIGYRHRILPLVRCVRS